MRTRTSVQNNRLPAASALALLLAACGGGSVGGTGSSSGGTDAVLAGTFSRKGASTSGSDLVFGAVDSIGNGFITRPGGSHPAIFAVQSASAGGKLSGFFAAYAVNGGNLDGTQTLQNGALSGNVATASGVTQASVTLANSASGFSNSFGLGLDNPALTVVPLATAAGTYAATTGPSAIASSAVSTSTAATYALSLGAGGGLSLSTSGGCSFNPGTASLDGTYNIYALQTAISCGGSSAVTLNGLAVYLPKGTASPVDGSALAADTLALELDDSLSSSAPKYALVLLAARQP